MNSEYISRRISIHKKVHLNYATKMERKFRQFASKEAIVHLNQFILIDMRIMFSYGSFFVAIP